MSAFRRHWSVTLEQEIRASVIAHAVRVGKCPAPGTQLAFTIDVKEGSPEILNHPERADLIADAKPVSEPQRVYFIVQQADIDNAIAMINAQGIIYREPKTSLRKLT